MAKLHQMGDFFRSIVASWTPISTESRFVQEGKLNPQEFIEAGDELVLKFPSWQWCSAHPKYTAPWLPPNKQYLITRNVPCRSRVRDLDKTILHHSITADGWFIPGADGEEESPPEVDIKEMEITKKKTNNQTTVSPVNPLPSSQPPLPTEHSNTFDELNRVLQSQTQEDVISINTPHTHTTLNTQTQNNVRTYDLSITYDKYYQSPRLWLVGYMNGKNLSQEEIAQDILSEYISKTVSMEKHPSTGLLSVSIHPCNHSAVMKKVVNGWISKKIVPRPQLSLVVFLKFISSVIPTIDYDCTTDIDTVLG